MCELHHSAASFKGIAERALGCFGVVAGMIAGILGTVLVFLRTEGGGLAVKIIVGGVFGFGMFILTWWVIAILIAPLLAVPEGKEARNAVKITRYLPFEKVIQLQFANEPVADLVQKASEEPKNLAI
jgi:hypothetical protein